MKIGAGMTEKKLILSHLPLREGRFLEEYALLGKNIYALIHCPSQSVILHLSFIKGHNEENIRK
jgi:hypothetical protein